MPRHMWTKEIGGAKGASTGEVRTNRTGLDSWMESVVAVGVVESRRAEDEWYSLSYGQCHKNLASGVARVRTDRAGVARSTSDPCRRSPLNKDGSWGRRVVSTRWRPKCICASAHLCNLCLRIKDEAGLFAGALGLELGGYTGMKTQLFSTCEDYFDVTVDALKVFEDG